MASILELGVNTGKWDSGLKKAKNALDNFIQANGGLSQALDKESAKMGKFVSMMGNMESKAKTAKGQMNDYKSSIEQLTMQYNRMTDAQKKAVGREYLQAIDQMKQKYHAVNEELQNMNRSLSAGKDSGGDGGGMSKFGGMMAVFGGNMMTKAAGWALNFASEIGDCVEKGIELAKAGEGIRLAFERLNRPDLLDKLREATHGTVTDLELMKQAVKFNDFNLSLDEMGTLLSFAQQKAKDTGESVDYMVDSIVTGLGRQSLMILDNLGISANEVKEKMKGTGDMTKAVAEIIRQQMSNAGDYIETAADRAAKADAELQNAMEELGRTFGPISDAGASMWHTLKVGALDLLNNAIKPLIDRFTELGRLRREYETSGGQSRVSGELDRLGNNKSEQNYKQVLAHYDLEINKKQQQLASLRNDAKMGAYTAGSSKFYAEQTNKLQAEIGALYKMRTEFVQGAQKLFNPPAAPAPAGAAAGGGTTTTKTGKGGGRVGGSGTHQESEEEKTAKMVKAAQDAYAKAIKTATMRFEAGMDNSEDLQKKELSARERLVMAYADAYAIIGSETYKNSFSDAAVEFNKLADVVKGKRKEFENSTQSLMGMSVNSFDSKLSGLLSEDMGTFAKRKGINIDTSKLTNNAKEVKEGWEDAARAVLSVGDALQQIEDPGAKVAGIIGQAIANIALGFAQATAASAAGGPFAWIAAIAGGLGTMLSTIAAIKSATAGSYAEGGIVPGNNYNDGLVANVSSGELILNRAQQSNIAAQLSGTSGAGTSQPYLDVETIWLGMGHYLKRKGMGEIVTTR